jgi:glycosyltransferase involved in cell wall biosynthesis
MIGGAQPLASVVITSRNRKGDLIEAIASCLSQTVPLEVIYLDDASEDGSHLAVAEKFPQVRIFREEQHSGYIVLRNRGARLARSNYIFSIDDDAIFTSPRIVEETLNEFDHPRIGAVAIPFKNIRISNDLLQRAPARNGIYVTSAFIGTAHALRRDLFLLLGGYRESLVHQGEEMEYCIRMLDAGYIVRLGQAEEIHHFVSPNRDMNRLHYYGSRNNLLFYWFNADAVRLPVFLGGTTAKTLAHAVRIGAVRIKLQATIDAIRYAISNHSERRPVSPAAFSLFRKLRAGPIELSSFADRLPPLPTVRPTSTRDALV